jgi:hypothetical protein
MGSEKAMSTAYQEGRKAFRDTRPASDNPYPSGRSVGGGMNKDRVYWFNGWYDMKFELKYPHLFP